MTAMTATFVEFPNGEKPINSKQTRFAILSQLVFIISLGDGQSTELIVPKGFITDFASIPRGLRWLLPKRGRYAYAAVLHDYVLQQGWPREYCALLFRLAMLDLNTRWWRRTLCFAGVRLLDNYLAFKAWLKGD